MPAIARTVTIQPSVVSGSRPLGSQPASFLRSLVHCESSAKQRQNTVSKDGVEGECGGRTRSVLGGERTDAGLVPITLREAGRAVAGWGPLCVQRKGGGKPGEPARPRRCAHFVDLHFAAQRSKPGRNRFISFHISDLNGYL